MKYKLFLFDLDDTLLDFKESERLSFYNTLNSFGILDGQDEIFSRYQLENEILWKLFEQGKTTKDFLKIERFRKTFHAFQIGANPEVASHTYLNTLPHTVVLMDHAEEICKHLSSHGEIGIITNGIEHVQKQRINNSPLKNYIHFISVSDECGFAKPDVRFFDFTVKKATHFKKESTIIIGDRFDADIIGAQNFGIDSCWFNPNQKKRESTFPPTFEIKNLSELKSIFRSSI